jgi:hypothetical protein
LRLDWAASEFDGFVGALPKVIKLYLGTGLDYVRTDSGFDFHFGENLGVLKSQYTYGVVSDDIFDNFCRTLVASEASSGLVATWQNSPFRVRLLRQRPRGWIPAVSWGRRQISAIAELNYSILRDVLKYSSYTPREGSENYGEGISVWSDIVNFMFGGIEIGNRLVMNPEEVKAEVLSEVSECFDMAGGKRFTYHDKVGADGWFHFRSSLDPNPVVSFAVEAQRLFSQLPSRSSLYDNSTLRVATGVHPTQSCRITRGGPYDFDSVVAYKVMSGHYDNAIRGTGQFVGLIPRPRTDWAALGTMTYLRANSFDVFGHTAFTGLNSIPV